MIPSIQQREKRKRKKMYHPPTNQFLPLDPVVDQTQQPYSYAADDPANEDDPTGQSGLALMVERKAKPRKTMLPALLSAQVTSDQRKAA